jgi:hypothetical protein
VDRRRYWQDIVRVSKACRNRNRLSNVLLFTGFSVGAPVGMQLSSSGAGLTFLSAAVGLTPFFGFRVSERRSGLQPSADYPPLRSLREAGWLVPYSASTC